MTKPGVGAHDHGHIPSGVRLPGDPPAKGSAFEVTMFYVDFYERDFVRAREVVKRRARHVVVWTAAANGGIAVVGAATTTFGVPWLGLVSTGLAAFVAVVAAWDGLFRHRELWVQRSMTLTKLHALKRTLEVRRASGADTAVLAAEGLAILDLLLAEDVTTWAEARRQSSSASYREAPAFGDAATGSVSRSD